ncbi:hypothetical protein M8J75_014500 [Diaphorina citri]|nr:hypothetical protein M8J75_014500 [Diaphorina citri]
MRNLITFQHPDSQSLQLAEKTSLVVPWIVGCITFMSLEAMAMVYSNVLRDHVNKKFDFLCKSEVLFFLSRAVVNKKEKKKKEEEKKKEEVEDKEEKGEEKKKKNEIEKTKKKKKKKKKD